MRSVFASLLFAFTAFNLSAASFTFSGNFSQDDNVQLFTFTVASASAVTVRTLSYAGGVNAMGAVIPEGGFDPYVALFDSTGVFLAENDDALGIPASPVTGSAYDALLQQTLAPGSYTLALTQFDNFALGPNLSSGFLESGRGNYTSLFGCSNGSFCDIDAFNRTSAWAIDFLNVASATGPGAPPVGVPEPSTCALMLTGASLAAAALLRCRHSM